MILPHKTNIYNLYIFSRNGTLLYYYEWDRTQFSGLSIEEEGVIMYGVIVSIKSNMGDRALTDSRGSFVKYQAAKYTINSLETKTGITFVMNTDNIAYRVRDLLFSIYQEVFLKFASTNPMIVRKRIINKKFKNELENLVTKIFPHVTKNEAFVM